MLILYVLVLEAYYVLFTGSTSSPLDEVLIVLFLPFALYAIVTARQLWFPSLMFAGYCAISMLGVIVYHYGGIPQPQAGLVDLVLDFKFLILVAGFFQIQRMELRTERGTEALCKVIIGLALLNSLFAIHDILSNGFSILGSVLEKRGLFFQPQGFQSHKVRSADLTVLGAAFALHLFGKRKSLFMLIAAIFLSMMVFAHQSVKELIAFFAIIVFMVPGGGIRGFKPIAVIFASTASLVIIFATPLSTVVTQRVDMFTGDQGQDKARTLLLARSIEIATDKFPIGTGAGTYGSGPSYQMGYSDVYIEYQMYKVWGISGNNLRFLQDAFWAKIIGQSGVLGTLFYVAFLLSIIHLPFKLNYRRRDGISTPACVTVILVLIVSIASSPFTDDFLGVLLAYFAANAMYLRDKRQIEML